VRRAEGVIADSKQPSIRGFGNQGTTGATVLVAGNGQTKRIVHVVVPLEEDIEGHEQPQAGADTYT
jgi:hypothetical protein